MKKSTKILLGAAAVGAAYVGIGEVMYRKFLTAAAARGGAPITPRSVDSDDIPSNELFIEGEEWYIDAEKQHWEAPSKRGGETLHAEMIFNEKASHVYVICLHGYNSAPSGNAPQAKFFYEQGYNVVLPSLCGHGRSEAPYVSMGWHDRIDVCRWIEEIIEYDDEAKIVLYGVSMGGATVMMTVGEELPENVVCAIEDCGYTSVDEQFRHSIKKFMKLPAFPFIDAGNLMTRVHAGYSFKEASSVEQLKKSRTPILFIHGTEDDFVPFNMVLDCYDAAVNCEKEIRVFEGSKHAKSVFDQPKEYFETVGNFIRKYL